MSLKLRNILVLCTSVLLSLFIASGSMLGYLIYDDMMKDDSKPVSGEKIDWDKINAQIREKKLKYGEARYQYGFNDGYNAGIAEQQAIYNSIDHSCKLDHNINGGGVNSSGSAEKCTLEHKEEYITPSQGQTLQNKVTDIVKKAAAKPDNRNSGVKGSDKSLKGKTINYYVPTYGNFALEDMTIKEISKKFGVGVNVKRVRSGFDYPVDIHNSVKAGKSVDLFSTTPKDWGSLHTYAKDITDYIDINYISKNKNSVFERGYMNAFRIPDKANDYYTAQGALQKVSSIPQDTDRFYAVSGVGAPYILAYNKDIVNESLLTNDGIGDTVITTDPAYLYDTDIYNDVTAYKREGDEVYRLVGKGAWSFDSYSKLINKINTKYTNKDVVGMAMPNTDIFKRIFWASENNNPFFIIGHEKTVAKEWCDNQVYNVPYNTAEAYFRLRYPEGKLGSIQFISEEDRKANIANFTERKVKNIPNSKNTSSEAVTAKYAFWHAEASEIPAIAKNTPAEKWDFVPYPSNAPYYTNTVQVGDVHLRSVPGWCVGFAVGQNSNKVNESLRFAEELTRVWKSLYEEPIYAALNKEQKVRYENMKENLVAIDFTSMDQKIYMNPNVSDNDKNKLTFSQGWLSYDPNIKIQVKEKSANGKVTTKTVPLDILSGIKRYFNIYPVIFNDMVSKDW